jgi:hypothetical protein
LTFCGHGAVPPQQSGHGAITLTIAPNPIVARPMSGNTYEFPFDAVIRETGGHAVTINSLTVNVYAFGGIPVGSDAYDTSRIASLGYPATVPANGELRYHFHPRKSVPDERLFGGVTADVRINATDDTATPTTATTSVTIRR